VACRTDPPRCAGRVNRVALTQSKNLLFITVRVEQRRVKSLFDAARAAPSSQWLTNSTAVDVTQCSQHALHLGTTGDLVAAAEVQGCCTRLMRAFHVEATCKREQSRDCVLNVVREWQQSNGNAPQISFYFCHGVTHARGQARTACKWMRPHPRPPAAGHQGRTHPSGNLHAPSACKPRCSQLLGRRSNLQHDSVLNCSTLSLQSQSTLKSM
jgi:hypothetical protein